MALGNEIVVGVGLGSGGDGVGNDDDDGDGVDRECFNFNCGGGIRTMLPLSMRSSIGLSDDSFESVFDVV